MVPGTCGDKKRIPAIKSLVTYGKHLKVVMATHYYWNQWEKQTKQKKNFLKW